MMVKLYFLFSFHSDSLSRGITIKKNQKKTKDLSNPKQKQFRNKKTTQIEKKSMVRVQGALIIGLHSPFLGPC